MLSASCSSCRRPQRTRRSTCRGIDKDENLNVEAGSKYLRLLVDTYLNDPAVTPRDQLLFAFAAYNAGPGNLRKFRAKAKDMGLDPNLWFGNVENAAAAIVGRETVQFVSNIYKYYVAYSLLDAHDADAAAAKVENNLAATAP